MPRAASSRPSPSSPRSVTTARSSPAARASSRSSTCDSPRRPTSSTSTASPASTPAAVRVGALVRHAGLEHSEEAYAVLPLLRQALVNVAHPAIRNRGTTVGSIAHADAAGEMPAILVLTDGVVEVAGPKGTREIAARDFFEGPLETSLAEDEMAVAVRFRRFATGTATAFAESARRHGDYAMAGVAAAVTATDGVITAASASFVSVTDVPTVLDLTDLLAGQEAAAADWSA